LDAASDLPEDDHVAADTVLVPLQLDPAWTAQRRVESKGLVPVALELV
jgi:hypothetical protein